RAQRLTDYLAANAASFRVSVQQTRLGARLIDCGVHVPGGMQAGLILARICLAGQAGLAIAPSEIGSFSGVQGLRLTGYPVNGCLACEYAGWQIAVGKFFGMGSGPMRAAYGKEPLFDKIPGRERPPVAVGVLESRKLPDDAVIEYLAERVHLDPRKMTLLVA